MDTLLGTDILLQNGDIQIASNQDFGTISGQSNLRQSVFNRLQTYLGEYYISEYGSELYKVIGQNQTLSLKNRIIGYVVETLLQEPRINNIENVSVEFVLKNTINISITFTIIVTNERFNLIFPNFVLN